MPDRWRPDPELVRRRDAVLAAAAVVSEAPGARLSLERRAPDPASSRAPSGSPSDCLLDVLRSRLLAVADDDALRRWVYHAEAAVARARRSPAAWRPGVESGRERERRIVVEWEGASAAEVAAWEGCTIVQVRAIRRENGRRTEDGARVEAAAVAEPVSRLERAERARVLARAGWAQRDIARELGVSQPTVQRDLAWISVQTPTVVHGTPLT